MKSRFIQLGALCGAAVLVAACSSQIPANDEVPDRTQLLTIAIAPNSYEQVILGEVYKQVLQRKGRDATVVTMAASEDSLLYTLGRSSNDIVIGCSGRLLHDTNPSKAAELAAQYADFKDPTPEQQDERRETTYKAMVSGLSNGLDAADPSNASGCADATDGLAENFVPIFRSAAVPRETRLMLNNASGAMTTKEVAELVSEAEAGESPKDLVSEYLDSKDV